MEMKNPTMKYRPDIDGLRAFAVLPVLFYHVGFSWMPGGFVGVDIFFVISGFLISKLIAEQARENRFSFGVFYARRIKRLFPALAFTIVVAGLGAFIFLTPEDFEEFAGSAVFSPMGLSNFFFWLETSYWDSSKYQKPLLHTWSLAVEEQYYLFWPILLVCLLRAGKKALLLCLAVLSVLSLLAAEWLLDSNPSAVFYLMPFRIAEFAIGAALVWLPRIPYRWLETATLAVGLGLIVGSVMLITEKMRFPGLIAMTPCAGAALAIYGGRAPILTHVLDNFLAVWIGKVSYSLYLVHWPIIVFWKYLTLAPLAAWEQWLIIAVSIVAAVAMYFFVEKPFRFLKQPTYSSFSLGATGAAMVVMALGATVWANQGWDWRLPQSSRTVVQKGGAACGWPDCHSSKPAPKDFVVVGDSFARMYDAGLRRRYKQIEGMDYAIFAYRPDCNFFRFDGEAPRNCDDIHRVFLDEVEKHDVDTLVIAHRWHKIGFEVPWANRPELYERRLEALLSKPELASVKTVVLILSVPEFQYEIDSRQCTRTPRWVTLQECETADTEIFHKIDVINQRVLSAFRRVIPDDVELRVEDPFDYLCNGRFCRQFINGNSVYWDKNHLTQYASRYSVYKWTSIDID